MKPTKAARSTRSPSAMLIRLKPLRRALLAAGCLSMLAAAPAQAELYFSKYIEGSANNKALEIYNPSVAAVDLSSYPVRMYFNGGTSAGLTVNLVGSVPAGGVFVLAHGSADAAALAEADQTSSSGWYNGDDAIVLDKGGVVIDSIGQIGFDPGAEWGSGLTSTSDNSLYRKASISSGDSNPFDAFDPALGWDGYALNHIAGLGVAPAGSGSGEGGNGGGGEVAANGCGDPFTPTYQIQGSGTEAAITGPSSTMGVVVGDYEGASSLRGFFIQDVNGDGNPLTSDGLFVFNGNNDQVIPGDLVRVTGTAGEFQGQTQISASTVIRCGVASVDPVDVALPFPDATHAERYEGMLVRMPQTLTVTEHFQLGRFGQVVLSSGGRQLQPTQVVEPGDPANELAAANALNRIIFDDTLNSQNPDPIALGRQGDALSASNTLRGGDTATGIVGVMNYTWGGNAASANAWRIRPVSALEVYRPLFEPANPRPANPPEVGGSLKVASFNVLNYFVSVDRPFGTAGDNVCGPLQNVECRGADSELELERQRAKLITALQRQDADIFGLIELENTAGVDVLADLVEHLNEALGEDRYGYIDTGVIGTDAIKVGLIYKVDRVAPTGRFAVLDAGVDSRFDSARHRPVLAQTFEDINTGSVFTVAVNHFKSKSDSGLAALCGNDPAVSADCDQGDGQGYWNDTRTLAAEALADWLATDPTASDDPDVLLLGDFNAYAQEDPIVALQSAGYTNLVPDLHGDDSWSYVFDGQWGSLDHALASESLRAQVTGADNYAINADEPSVLDYNVEFKSVDQIVSLFGADEFRTSDHDPLRVGLNLDGLAPTLALEATPQLLWPANHKMVTVRVRAEARDDLDPSPLVRLLSVSSNESDDGLGDGDTAGDIEIINDFSVRLRAERSGGGDGRIYTLRYEARDFAGNTSVASLEVRVPHSRRR